MLQIVTIVYCIYESWIQTVIQETHTLTEGESTADALFLPETGDNISPSPGFVDTLLLPDAAPEDDLSRLLCFFFGAGDGLLDRVRQATGGDSILGSGDEVDEVETSTAWINK